MRSLRIASALRRAPSIQSPTSFRALNSAAASSNVTSTLLPTEDPTRPTTAPSAPSATASPSPGSNSAGTSTLSSSPSSPSSQPKSSDPSTHFGFQTVSPEEKTQKVHSVFASVASQYDLMNDLMSGGLHRLWKSHFVSSLNPGRLPGSPHPQTLLDVAGGTGDISFRLLEHATDVNKDCETTVLCCDINGEMLKEGQRRLETDPALGRWRERIEFREENAETLDSIPDASVDLYTISFGIRNVTDIPKALRTAYRVLKPGGVFAVLEFSRVRNPVLEELYKRYSFGVIPIMGQVVAGDRDGYQYLVESIQMFPSQERFAEMIREAGFKTSGSGFETLTFGVANIWKGVKV